MSQLTSPLDRTLLDLLPDNVAEAASHIPAEYADWDEHDFQKKLKPGIAVDRVRLAFWIEYDAAQDQNRKMNMTSVYRGAMHRPVFQQQILNKPEMLAYVLTPPTDYILSLKAILYRTIKHLEKITLATTVTEDGKVNIPLATLMLQIHKAMDLKIHGAAIQRIESKVMTVSTSIDAGEKPEDVAKKLEELRRQSTQISQGTIIDVGPKGS